jgi:DNA invertase Pin-like site-specific DNA recombinase
LRVAAEKNSIRSASPDTDLDVDHAQSSSSASAAGLNDQSIVKTAVYVCPVINRPQEFSAAEQDLDAQLRPLIEWLRHRGGTLHRICSDRTSSNKHVLHGFQNLLEDAHRGEFQVLLVWRLDCLARGAKKLVLSLDELFELGVDFVCLRDEFDATTSGGKKNLETIDCLANIERACMKEQVSAGVEHARLHGIRSGRAIGRPKCNFHRKRLIQSRRLGWSYRKIEDELGIGLETVTRTLCEANETLASEPANQEV